MTAPSESTEAKQLATYLNALVQYKQIICYTKTAQETFSTSWGAKMRQKSEGVQRGIPDYVILTKTKVIFLELKKQRGVRNGLNGSVIAPEQLLWIDTLNSYNSNEIVATIAHGANEAIAFIEEHI